MYIYTHTNFDFPASESRLLASRWRWWWYSIGSGKGRGIGCEGWGADSFRRASIISKCTLDDSSTKRFAISSFRANTWHIITGIIAAEQNGPPPLPFILTPPPQLHHPLTVCLHHRRTTIKNPNGITSAIIGISDPYFRIPYTERTAAAAQTEFFFFYIRTVLLLHIYTCNVTRSTLCITVIVLFSFDRNDDNNTISHL